LKQLGENGLKYCTSQFYREKLIEKVISFLEEAIERDK